MPAEPVLLAGRAPPARGDDARDYDADIVIISHFRVAETMAAISSAQAQAGGAFWVIVLDQGSDQAMRDQVSALVARLARVAFYGIAENLGVPGGRNLACGLGRGRVMVALDNDAVFAGRWVVAQAVRRIEAAPRLGVIGFRILAADGGTLDATSWGYPRTMIGRAAERFDATTFVGCGYAMRRRCFEQVGGFDARLFFTWEEYEFARHAIAAGWEIAYHGDLAVHHAVTAQARVRWEGARWGYYVRNRLLIAHQWHGWLGMVPLMAVYGLRGLLAGRVRATMQAMIEAVRMARQRARLRMGAGARAYIWRNETSRRFGFARWGLAPRWLAGWGLAGRPGGNPGAGAFDHAVGAAGDAVAMQREGDGTVAPDGEAVDFGDAGASAKMVQRTR